VCAIWLGSSAKKKKKKRKKRKREKLKQQIRHYCIRLQAIPLHRNSVANNTNMFCTDPILFLEHWLVKRLCVKGMEVSRDKPGKKV
jgi:hypothetical protein